MMMKNENRAGKAVLAFLRVVLLVLGVSAAAYAESASGDILAGYPADYPIAWLNTQGYAAAPTVRELFGPTAPFATCLEGLTYEVAVDSASVVGDRLTVALMMTTKVPLFGDVKVARLEVQFQSDKRAQRSYVRHLKITDMVFKRKEELFADPARAGGAKDADMQEIHRWFAQILDSGAYWDVEKLRR